MKVRKTSQDLFGDELGSLDWETVEIILAKDISEGHAHDLKNEADMMLGAWKAYEGIMIS